MLRIQQLKLDIQAEEKDLISAAAKALHVAPGRIQSLKIRKRSIDARKKPQIFYVYTVDVSVEKERAVLKKCRNSNVSIASDPIYAPAAVKIKKETKRPVIIGMGPAGLFCALFLARAGMRPLILERGADVLERQRAVECFWKTGILDERTNIQFGEGGAGTFSDGKLNTAVKDITGRNRYILETFVEFGAPSEILWMNKPHIGTDLLRDVIRNIRIEIERLGGEVRFFHQVTDLCISHGHLTGVTVNGEKQIPCTTAVLAIGHSARDTFKMLEQRNISMTQKAFAVGVRVEHPQELIDLMQYGQPSGAVLPAADYKLTCQLADGRGVYSFCMCPGGYVVNASSEKNRLAVNGMSYHSRSGKNANSAIVVTVTSRDFGGSGVLAGMEFQRRLEELAWNAGNGKVPVQLFDDFCRNRKSTRIGDIIPCIKGAWDFGNLRSCFPEAIGHSIVCGMQAFGQKIPGFDRGDTVLSGVESRTSSPVRVERDKTLQSSVMGLYPCGEGAGYAGGITSAAMDGLKVAEMILSACS